MEMAALIFFISIFFPPQMVSMMKGSEIEAGITNLRLLTFTRVSASSIHISRPSIGLLELPASFPTSRFRVDSTPQQSNVILHLQISCDVNVQVIPIQVSRLVKEHKAEIHRCCCGRFHPKALWIRF